jgi:hypothetical protein
MRERQPKSAFRAPLLAIPQSAMTIGLQAYETLDLEAYLQNIHCEVSETFLYF